MEILKKASLLCTLTLLSLLTFSCREKSEGSVYEIIPPTIVSADGQSVAMKCSDFYHIEINDKNRKYAEEICGVFGAEATEENLNSLCFGENIFGAGLASVVYFGKYADSLTENQWEKLCDIGRDPEKYVSALMDKTQDSREFSLNPHGDAASRISYSAYFDTMIEEIVSDLVKDKGYSRSEAFRLIYSDGVTIKTPYSVEIQDILDRTYANSRTFTSVSDDRFPQSACVIMDYEGGVIAAVGGNNGNNAYNRSGRILHPLGSSIKPLAVYAPAVEKGIINFSSLIQDAPVKMSNSPEEIWPANYNGLYEGEVTVTYALRQSKNTVPVRLGDAMGTENCLAFLRDNFRFTTLTDNDNNIMAMAMGYLDQGVSLAEVTAAYGVFGSNGVYNPPRYYDQVLDKDGNVIISKKAEPRQAVSSETAGIMNRLLRYNISGKDAIASAAGLENGVEVIGKTGTMNSDIGNDTEKIFVGGTPEYIAAVWLGFDSEGASIEEFSYVPPTEIWNNIMSQLPLEKKEFDIEKSLVRREYCTVSGGAAGRNCNEVEEGYYTKETELPECTIH